MTSVTRVSVIIPVRDDPAVVRTLFLVLLTMSLPATAEKLTLERLLGEGRSFEQQEAAKALLAQLKK